MIKLSEQNKWCIKIDIEKIQSIFNPAFIELEALAGGYEYEIILMKLYKSATIEPRYTKDDNRYFMNFCRVLVGCTENGGIDFYELSETIRHRESSLPDALAIFSDKQLIKVIPPGNKE